MMMTKKAKKKRRRRGNRKTAKTHLDDGIARIKKRNRVYVYAILNEWETVKWKEEEQLELTTKNSS